MKASPIESFTTSLISLFTFFARFPRIANIVKPPRMLVNVSMELMMTASL